MSEEKKSQGKRFKIKWADREVEYYGDDARELYNDLIAYVKEIPTEAPTPKVSEGGPSTTTQQARPPTIGRELELIARDVGIPIERLVQALEIRSAEGFAEQIPFLPTHPDVEEAALIACYALQVGFQRSPIEVVYLKRILEEPNGYPLPGNSFGLILREFRRRRWTITSQTRGKYRPFSLSGDGGLQAAREALRRMLG